MRKKCLITFALGWLLCGCVATSVVNEPKGDLRAGSPDISPVLQQQLDSRTLKRKVAIARFSNETKYGNNFLQDGYGDRIWNGRTLPGSRMRWNMARSPPLMFPPTT